MSDRPVRPNVPEIEWVFACNTVLGRVAPRFRTVQFNGKDIFYRPRPELDRGARWCSEAWLEKGLGVRGFPGRSQSGLSRMMMRFTGQVSGGLVVVVPDQQLAAAVDLANTLLSPGRPVEQELREWSMALVRQPGRTRPALRIDPVLDDGERERVLEAFRSSLDIEWLFSFGMGHTVDADTAELLAPDGTVLAQPAGEVRLEADPIPTRLVELAALYGDGLRLAGPSAAIPVPDDSHRPLERDELDTDHDLRGWQDLLTR